MAGSDEVGLVWFRRDLRLDANPAWAAATSERNAVVPLYVLDPRLLEKVGPYRRRQLIATLQALDFDLFDATGGRLLVRFGDPTVLVPEAVNVFQAGGVYWNADVSPFATRRDEKVRSRIDATISTHWGSLVLPPGSVLTKKGTLSRVFTPFHKTWLGTDWDDWPEAGEAIIYDDPGEALPRLDDQPTFFEGEKEAHRRLAAFLERVDDYENERNRADIDGTSQLSSDLRFGTISPRAVVEAVGDGTPARRAFVRQLAWRDWFAHLLLEHPSMPDEPLNPKYTNVPWRNVPAEISAWKGGFTGYPIVDAGMRQLRETGWMPNRVRMIVGSFLVKDLLVDWRIGEKHFRHLLVDFDAAQNVGNWQWVAGVGTDAAPYFRIFHPVAQGQEHDPDGSYVRRWVPELAKLPGEWIHAPWVAPDDVLAAADVELGRDYPHPIVDHVRAREEFLSTFKALVDADSSETATDASTTDASAADETSTDADEATDETSTDADEANAVTTEPDEATDDAPAS